MYLFCLFSQAWREFVVESAVFTKVALHFVVDSPACRQISRSIVVDEMLSPHANEIFKFVVVGVYLYNFFAVWIEFIFV